MRKDAPILIVGFGSIGQRHFRNLRALGYSTIAVHDVDHAKVASVKATLIPSLTSVAYKQFAAVLVCNPTDMHLKVALAAVRAGCHVFIEKPLASNSRGTEVLVNEARKRKVVAIVASNFRFDRAFITLEKKLKSKKYGKPLCVLATFTRDLSRTPHYSKSYAASPKGGGVLFDLGPHVLEYLSALFGDMRVVRTVMGKRSSLKIKTDDFAAGVCVHKSGVYSCFELDYFSNPKRHRLEVQCERGMLSADFTKSDRNDMYVAQLKHFFSCIDGKERPLYDVARGVDVLKMLESIRIAARKGE